MTDRREPGPDFVGIGPGKTGTSWVWAQLRDHPDVYLPDEKELHYFDVELYGAPGAVNLRSQRPLDWYRAQFASAPAGAVRGEITPSYFLSASAPAALMAAFPAVRVFAVLREPVDRLFSMYLFARQKGEIAAVDFERAIAKHPWLLDRAAQAPALERWIRHVPGPQLMVGRYDDLRADPDTFLGDLQRFLGVAARPATGAGVRVNETGAHPSPRLNRALAVVRLAARRRPATERWVERARAAGLGGAYSRLQRRVEPFPERPRPDPATAARLAARFRPDVERIEALTGLDLDSWKAAA